MMTVVQMTIAVGIVTLKAIEKWSKRQRNVLWDWSLLIHCIVRSFIKSFAMPLAVSYITTCEKVQILHNIDNLSFGSV